MLLIGFLNEEHHTTVALKQMVLVLFSLQCKLVALLLAAKGFKYQLVLLCGLIQVSCL